MGNLSITIDSELAERIREKAAAEGLSTDADVESLVRADRAAEEELESLALEGLDSGAPLEAGAAYWAEKLQKLEDRLTRPEAHGVRRAT